MKYKKIEQLRGSIMRLFGKLYTAEQLYNEELLTSNMKPYPKNEEIEKFMLDILQKAYEEGYSKGHSTALSICKQFLDEKKV